MTWRHFWTFEYATLLVASKLFSPMDLMKPAPNVAAKITHETEQAAR